MWTECVCIFTMILKRSLAQALSSSLRGSFTFISSDCCSLSIKLSMYFCSHNSANVISKSHNFIQQNFGLFLVDSEQAYLRHLSSFWPNSPEQNYPHRKKIQSKITEPRMGNRLIIIKGEYLLKHFWWEDWWGNLTFRRESIVFLSCTVNGRCWYSSLISRTLGQFLTGWCWAVELVALSLRVKPNPKSVPKGGPVVFS